MALVRGCSIFLLEAGTKEGKKCRDRFDFRQSPALEPVTDNQNDHREDGASQHAEQQSQICRGAAALRYIHSGNNDGQGEEGENRRPPHPGRRFRKDGKIKRTLRDVKPLRPVKKDLPCGDHNGPAREDGSERHKDHTQRRDVEDAEEKIRREPERNKGERHKTQKSDELDAEEIKIRKRVPAGGVVVHRTNSCVRDRDRHPLLRTPNDVTLEYSSAQPLTSVKKNRPTRPNSETTHHEADPAEALVAALYYFPMDFYDLIIGMGKALISYIVNHALHGDTIFPGHGSVRTLYLSILASHVILSMVALPMVLTTFFFSLTGRFAMHRRIARFTFPIWLYVSITGVVVFVFLKAYAY